MLGRSRSQVYGLWRNTTSPYINEKIFSMKRKKKRKTTITTGLREENKNWRPILNSNSITYRYFLFISDESISYNSMCIWQRRSYQKLHQKCIGKWLLPIDKKVWMWHRCYFLTTTFFFITIFA